VARINRKLAKNDQQLRRARGVKHQGYWHPDSNLGWYYAIDVNRNWIVETHVDLEELGRRLEVLANWEQLAEE